MSNRTKYLCLAAVTLLLLVVVVCFVKVGQESISPFYIQLSVDGKSETIQLWERENGEYYVFLPSYAELSNSEIRLTTTAPIAVNDEIITDGMSCAVFQYGVAYSVTYTLRGRQQHNTVVFMKSGNVPTIHIKTASGTMDYIHSQKGNEETGTVSVYTAEGILEHAGELLSIKGRGNSTWSDFDKKAYSVELSCAADLLGMGEAENWILLANAEDSSHFRNKIVYDFAEKIGLAYSPDSRWVDVYLNGEYAGLYLLCERNELHAERINIAQGNSFVVSLEMLNRLTSQNYIYVLTEQKQALRVHYPLNPSNEELTQIAETWQSIENALLSEDGVDPQSGKTYTELIDLESWIKKYLVEEIFANVDACFISQYFYYDGETIDGKIYAGPVWDYDHALGTKKSWEWSCANVFYANRVRVRSDGAEAPWFYYLYQKDEFYEQMLKEYETVFIPALDILLNTTIQVYVQEIEYAASMDYVRWSVESDGIWKEAEDVVNFLKQRIRFLNDMWIEESKYYIVSVDRGFSNISHLVVQPGDCLGQLPELGDTENEVFVGWYYTATDTPVDFNQPITEDIEIYAKWEDSSTKKIKQIAKLAPVGIIGLMGVALLVYDVKRTKRNG